MFMLDTTELVLVQAAARGSLGIQKAILRSDTLVSHIPGRGRKHERKTHFKSVILVSFRASARAITPDMLPS